MTNKTINVGKIVLFFLVSSAFLWFAFIVNQSGLELILATAAVISLLLFVDFLAVWIGERFCRNTSPYRIFAIVNSCIGVCVVAYAIYDIKTDTGWFAGLLGCLLLVIIIPIIIIFLLADFIIWRIRKTKRTHR